MKLTTHAKEKGKFRKAYKTATDDERKEMIIEYKLDHGEDYFITKIEKAYKQQGWQRW